MKLHTFIARAAAMGTRALRASETAQNTSIWLEWHRIWAIKRQAKLMPRLSLRHGNETEEERLSEGVQHQLFTTLPLLFSHVAPFRLCTH
jgi:hypothetical protein